MKKNKFKPAYIVDITNCEDCHDMLYEFAITKHNAGFAITDEELEAIVDENSTVTIIENTPVIIDCKCKNEKKLPWYKRFWNWLIRKK